MQKKMVWLIVLLFVSFISAQNISLDYPASNEVGEEFEITVFLMNFEPGDYDIKFEIMEGNKNIAQRLWEDTWKSTHYWIKGAFVEGENEKEFSLKIVDDVFGEKQFKVKIRNSKETWIYDGFVMDIQPGDENQDDSDDKKDKEDKKVDKREKEDNEKINKEERTNENESIEISNINNTSSQLLGKTISSPIMEEKIIQLGSKKIESKRLDISSDSRKVIYSSTPEKMKKYALFAFAFVCIVFSLLVIWKKI
ncbi:hypothetical protein J4456_02410 [Candidatus Pacearchaeota archaeon]|nr:hypothetical protein [Candidatus Pacearchaeota archaeon]